MKKRNSLIELYRFLFSMNVVKNHGYFPYQGKYFTPGRISVEFFFVLSGWFLVKSIDKFVDMPYFKGLFYLLKSKIVSLGVPLAVGLIFNIAYKCIVGMEDWWDFSIWGYLWYVHVMLIVFIFYFTIRKFVKSKKWFLIITAIVFIASSVIHSLPMFYSWGYFRGFSAMSAGILISFIPKIKIKKQWLVWIPLACIWLLILKMFLFDFSFVEDEILNFVLYPALVYFSFQLTISNKVFNYLGSLSFGLYAYQSIPRFIEALGYENVWVSFTIILFCALTTDLIKRYIKHRKSKKAIDNSQTL